MSNDPVASTEPVNPTGSISAGDISSPTTLGNATTFTATITGGSDVTYQWAFGDGSMSTGNPAIHMYGAAGSYTAIVTATNSAGSVMTTTGVVINAVQPIPYKLYLPTVRRDKLVPVIIYLPLVMRDSSVLNLLGGFLSHSLH